MLRRQQTISLTKSIDDPRRVWETTQSCDEPKTYDGSSDRNRPKCVVARTHHCFASLVVDNGAEEEPSCRIVTFISAWNRSHLAALMDIVSAKEL